MQKRRRHIGGQQRKPKGPRTNEYIKAPEVRLVTEEGSEVLSIEQALERAKEEELDLIEVSPKANPPVVKIDDFGRYKYRMQKKEKLQKAHSKQTEVKMLRLSFRTERHDLERLLDRAKDFLKEGHLVKFTVQLRGREMANKDYAKEKLQSLVDELKEEAEVEQPTKQQGRQFIVILRAKRS